MSLSVAELDHVVLRVVDLERSLRFYTHVLGCREERRVEAANLVQLRAGRALIDLVVVDEPAEASGNMDHFCVRLDPFEEEEIRKVLRENGVTAGRTARRYGAGGMGPSIYIEDPDGNVVELKGPPDPT
ncbi:VOC family protein [Myxococcota bacterium]|nr:VOC family protein [Myxococcota bacterium]